MQASVIKANCKNVEVRESMDANGRRKQIAIQTKRNTSNDASGKVSKL